jgi:ABC-type branched-subunit amino acid transport system substrate-binding protein
MRSWLRSKALLTSGIAVLVLVGASAVPATAGVPRTAGVTPDSITVGLLIPQTGAANAQGANIDVGNLTKQYQAFVDAINDKGGINGRKITTVAKTYNPLDNDDMRAACLSMTQDSHAFAVLNTGGYFGDAVLCLTEQNKTVLLSADGFTKEFYDRSKGRLFTTTISKDRALEALAAVLNKEGALGTKKHPKRIGIVANDFLGGLAPVQKFLVPALTRLGHKPAHVTVLPGDFATAPAQIPLEVTAMKDANVDTIILATNTLFAMQFVTEAQAQQLDAHYLTSDFAQGASDFWARNMPPDAFDGARAVTATRSGAPASEAEPAFDASCVATYEAQTGKKLEAGSDERGAVLTNCTLVNLFELGAKGAGKNLTTASFSKALEGLATVDLAARGGGGFTTKKFNAPDLVRVLTWRANCKCWQAKGKFEPFTAP